jgi:ATP-dependent Clp protease ATP-binding subunit ClpA
MIKYDRFSIRARAALARADEFVKRYGHSRIDTEHLLLSLIEQVRSPVPKLLEMLQVDVNALIDRVIFSLQASPKSGITGAKIDKYLLTTRAIQIVDRAIEEAGQLEGESILPEHLLLAMFSERDTPATQLLESNGLTRERVADALLQLRARGEDDLAWED